VTIETEVIDCSNLIIGYRLDELRQLNTGNVNVNCEIDGEYVSCL